MAIKINNKNLQKRIINGKEVEKVILNWSQIRPTEILHIDYHIIGDFTGWWGWWLPWWWEAGSWVIVDEDWIRSETWQTVHARYTWMPSLLNAKKIEIITKFYWDWLYDINEMAFTNYIVNPLYEYPNIGWYLYHDDWNRWNPIIRYYGQATFSQLLTRTQEWIYLMKTEIHLEREWWPWIFIFTKKEGEEYVQKNSQSMSPWDIQRVRESQYFDLWLWQSVVVKKVDFYIYNN